MGVGNGGDVFTSWLCMCAHGGISWMVVVEVIISLFVLHCSVFKTRCNLARGLYMYVVKGWLLLMVNMAFGFPIRGVLATEVLG